MGISQKENVVRSKTFGILFLCEDEGIGRFFISVLMYLEKVDSINMIAICMTSTKLATRDLPQINGILKQKVLLSPRHAEWG